MTNFQMDLIELDAINAGFFEGLAASRLLIQQCAECGHRQFYPKPLCAACGGLKLRWVDASTKGKVYTYTVINRVIGNSKEFEKELPYVVGSVELEDGVRIYARLVASDPKAIKIGSAAIFEPHRLSEKVGLPYFRVEAE